MVRNNTRALSFHAILLTFKTISRAFPRALFPIANRAGFPRASYLIVRRGPALEPAPGPHPLSLPIIFLKLDYLTIDATVRMARAGGPYP
jgi:hypothetical protein